MDHDQALTDLIAWATADDNIRLVVLTGSLARGEGVDPLSDLDIELYLRDPNLMLADRTWYGHFGDVLGLEELENPGWNPTRLIHYVDGKIDFMIGSVDSVSTGIGYDREFRVLVDKDDLADCLRREIRAASPPRAGEFWTCVNRFAAAALNTARSIVRDEPWMAKVRDAEVKETLLQMIEWDHRARHGWDHDTWHDGVHLRQWMDRDVQAALERCWARFSLADATSALLASMDLFGRLAARTADELGFPRFGSERLKEEVRRILDEAG